MILKFSKKVAESIGYYVYILRDPESGKVFYVGKGTGNRLFAHVKAAIKNAQKSDKLDRIRKIISKDLEVEYEILRHGMTENEAVQVESALIDFIHLPNLTNKVAGRYSDIHGAMTLPEIIAVYDAKPVTIKEPVLLVIPNRLFHKNISKEQLYEITRGNWVVGEKRNIPKYAFSVHNGVVIEVYRIFEWSPAKARDMKQKTQARWRFNGEIAFEMQHYVGKSVLSYIGAQNPIRYVNC
jgi:uncharacterized protein